jgi:hypothetical protein
METNIAFYAIVHYGIFQPWHGHSSPVVIHLATATTAAYIDVSRILHRHKGWDIRTSAATTTSSSSTATAAAATTSS